MARIRTIKPSFFTNEQLADLPPMGRLVFIGLWTIADKCGRLEDRPRRIKVEIAPFDDVDIDDVLSRLVTMGFIERYEVDGRKYIQIVNFQKHQKPHPREQESEIPAKDSTSREKALLGREKAMTSRVDKGKEISVNGDLTLSEGKVCPGTAPPDGRTERPTSPPAKAPPPAPNPHPPPNPPPGPTVHASELPPTQTPAGVPDPAPADAFDRFWSLYPRKQSELTARRAWGAMLPDASTFEAIMAGLRAQLACPEWQREGGRFVPKPATWLSERRWRDDVAPRAPPAGKADRYAWAAEFLGADAVSEPQTIIVDAVREGA